jgi:glycosyltransferase involved in cell wall biosynthesis
MRILHICAGNLYGGIEKLLVTFASERRLCPEMEPVFGVCFDGRLAEELRAAGVEVHLLGGVRLSRPWTGWRARRRLNNLLVTSPRFDLAITHSGWLHAVFASAVRGMGTPLWFWAHDSYGAPSRIDRIAARTKPDRIVANSYFTLSTVPRVFPDIPGEVIYCAVPAPAPMDRAAVRQQVRRELGCSTASSVILMTARLETWKGHTLLLEALSKLQPQDWVAWIAGGPQRPHEERYYAQLQEMARKLEIADKVRWLGQRSDMPRLLAAADIHCQPNTGPEPFGIVFIEAMQAGAPVVTTRLGAAPETVDDTCGVLTPPADAIALAEALAKLMTPEGRSRFIGGPARAKLLCDPATQLNLLRAAVARSNAGDRTVAVPDSMQTGG